MFLSLGNTEGWVEQTWVCRFCHLARGRYFLARNGKSLNKRKENFPVP